MFKNKWLPWLKTPRGEIDILWERDLKQKWERVSPFLLLRNYYETFEEAYYLYKKKKPSFLFRYPDSTLNYDVLIPLFYLRLPEMLSLLICIVNSVQNPPPQNRLLLPLHLL